MRARFALALLAAIGSVIPQGCERAAASTDEKAAPAPSAEMVVVLIDRSMSRTPIQMDADKQLLKGVIQGLGFGDRLILSRVHAVGQADDVKAWASDAPNASSASAPTPVDSVELERWRNSASKAAETVFAARLLPHTDLIASLADDADYIRESHRPLTRIVIFSDMLQSTGGTDFESGVIPSDAWVANRKANGTLPRLPNACVVVVGAETQSPRGAAVRAFWEKFFTAAGARLSENSYRYTATDPTGLRC